ncbi:MAG: FAD-dependent oxidoreductase [Bacteroidia bacterium]
MIQTNLSFWEKKSYFNNIDVAIIGSGIVGLNAAIALQQKNKKLKIIVLERGVLPSGASTKNAGFACFGSSSELLDDLSKHSENEVFSLVEKRWKGLLRLRKNIGDKALDFKQYGGYEIFDKKIIFQNCLAQTDYLNKHISKIISQKNIFSNAENKIKSFGFQNVVGMIENTQEGQIDTGKMMFALLKKAQSLGIIILNASGVKSFTEEKDSVQISTENGFYIDAKKMLIATNGFAKQFLPDYPVNPARAQVLITSPIKNLKIKGTFHYDKGYYYFRNFEDRILFGGARNLDFKTEETTEMGLTDLVQNRLEHLLKTMILPKTNFTIEQRWSGIMGIGTKKSVIIKAVSKNIFCAVRLGGMGIAIGSLIGEEAAEMVEKSL